MSQIQTCVHEAAVTAAQRRGDWTPGLRRHAVSCPVCADALLAGAFLSALEADLAARSGDRRALAEPARLLWRAHLRQRADQAAGAAARATLPIRFLYRLAAAVGTVVAAALALDPHPRLAGWLVELRRSLPEASRDSLSPEALALALGGLLLALLLAALHASWAEE